MDLDANALFLCHPSSNLFKLPKNEVSIVCSWRQIVLLTMGTCKFVSMIILLELCVCVCCLCGNLASVYSRLLCGQTADLGQKRDSLQGQACNWCGVGKFRAAQH